MKRLTTLALLALALGVAAPAFSQSEESAREPLTFASSFLTIPTMANTPGQFGAVFQTHVSIMNPTSNAFPVHVSYYDASGVKKTADIPLAAGELKVYENFIQSVFNVSGTAGAATFATDDTPGGTHNNRVIVSTETWTLNAAGDRFGTTVPVLEFPGTDSRSFAAGVTVDSSSRTNVGCFNQSGSVNEVAVAIFDGAGKQVGSANLSLPAHAWGQTGVSANVTNGYARFSPADAAVCWAVIVNNKSNDARFVSSVEYTP